MLDSFSFCRIKMKDGFYKDDFEVPESVDRKQIEALMDEGTGERIPALVFKFQHQISEDTYRTEEEEEEVEDQGSSLTAVNEDKPSDVDNYGFLPQKDFGRFMESFIEGTEPMIIRFGEPLIGFVEDEGKMGMRFLTSEELLRDQMGEGAGQIESTDFDPDTETSSDGYSVKEINYDSDFEGFLSEKDCGKERSGSENEEPSMKSVSKLDQEQRESFFLDRSEEKEDLTAQNSFRRSHSEEASSENECRGEPEAVVLASEGLEKTAENGFKSSIHVSEETEQKEDKEAEKREQEAKKLQTEDTRGFDYEELDELWEHQDLIEQLKIELKKARAFGLPTISKQTQNSRAIEDLKPFKIDEKLLPEHPNGEHQKFYKSYRDSMRKFDILNYQKMYTMRKHSNSHLQLWLRLKVLQLLQDFFNLRIQFK
ncbi:hypothetical protein AXF42_Ash011784 [Apostasia shenzhenica]|uniref:Uncharacterized protein n=1 Tax=Apostasia shenzhenica TaxID=1088818 RepID=A0A2H9ZUZ7_9ASPA|nr:hypothetical protein AXF42_Ash011784 [Apostasia shenzhenica]